MDILACCFEGEICCKFSFQEIKIRLRQPQPVLGFPIVSLSYDARVKETRMAMLGKLQN